MDREEKVIYFPGCFATYYEPMVSIAFLSVMEENNIGVSVSKQLCCGMPMMANTNYKGAKKNFTRITKSLAGESKGKYDIITTCPSCNMMLKKEGKAFFESEEAIYVSQHLYDASEYLLKLERENRLKKKFGKVDLQILYHNPCHLKVQSIDATFEILKLIPGIEIVGVNKDCCGMGGSFGMKKKNYELSSKIGMKVWKMVEDLKPKLVVTECGGCALQIGSRTSTETIHPMVLLAMAYLAGKKGEVKL